MDELYGVKIVYTYMVNNKKFYEEMILSVRASSIDEAYEKADKYAKQNLYEYININDDTVTIQYEILDCFIVYDMENDIQEVYSMYSTNNTRLTDEEYYMIITERCEKDELYPLRSK